MTSAKIKLTQGKYAIVDAEDFEKVSAFKWCYAKGKSWKTGYAMRGITRRHKKTGGKDEHITISLHRFILGFPAGITDHINGDGLDNRKCNLRMANFAQNSQNQKMAKNNTSGFKGVSFFKPIKKWAACIMVAGKKMFLGYFSEKTEAADAYNIAAKKFFGEFANLNKL